MSDFGIPITSLDGSTGAAPATQVPAPPVPAAPQLSVIPELRMPNNADAAYNQVATFAVAGLHASEDAAVKNNAVLSGVQRAQDENYQSLLTANQNLHKINSMPHGIVKILGMFDDSWNASNQALDIEAANLKQQHVTSQAQTLMQINNTTPQLIEDTTKIARELSTGILAVDANSMEHTKLQQAAMGLAMEKIRTGIAMSAESRAKAEFAVSGMGEEDTNAMIAKLKADPNNPNRGMLGMLEEHATKIPLARAALMSAQAAANKGNREEEAAQMQTFTDNLPAPQLQASLAQAQKTGAVTVHFGPKVGGIEIPVPTVMRSLAANQKLSEDAHAKLAQQEWDDSNIPQRTTSQVSAATSLASVDPRAKNVVDMLGHASAAFKLNPTYENAIQFKAIQDQNDKILKEISTNFSKSFKSKEAQGAIEQFGTSGKFDRVGAGAVLGDVIGNPSLVNATKFGAAQGILNQAVAIQLAKAQVQGGAGLTGQTGTMDSADIAALINGNKGNPKLAAIREQVLNDPSVMGQVKNTIKSSLQQDALESAIINLSRSKNASPVWHSLIEHKEQIMKPVGDGNFAYDLGKLADVLEKATVMTHGKVDYSHAFLSSLRVYGSQADATSGSDPRNTIYDHALTAYVFGDKPHAAIAGDLANTFGKVSDRAHAEMQGRIENDVSGRTQAQATQQAARESQYGGLKGLPDPTKIPSATGTSLSAEQIKSLYGGN